MITFRFQFLITLILISEELKVEPVEKNTSEYEENI